MIAPPLARLTDAIRSQYRKTADSDLAAAGRAGVGAALGLALGAAAKLAIAFAMVGVIVVMRLL